MEKLNQIPDTIEINSVKVLLTISALMISLFASAQDSLQERQPKLVVNGYIKNLESLTFDKEFNNLVGGNLIHNRLNFKWKPSDKITGVAEFRNRLIWGDIVRQDSNFAASLRNDNEWMDMQKAWLSNPSLALHTNTERLYLDYRDTKWNVRIGRQRINWGVTTTWNPNDIFNAYNFLDFDYEERPGADGGKAQYLFNDFTNVELAYVNTGQKDGSIAAMRFSMNKWKYDLHLITGWYKQYPTVGAGWAGNIKQAGFKGEVQYYLPASDSVDHLNISVEADYMFKKGWYVNISGLYNNYGTYKPVGDWREINLQFSPMHLMPTRWNVIATTSKEFTPLFTGSLSAVFAPGTNLLIVFPTLQYSLATNLDVSLVWQSFFYQTQNEFQAASHIGFLRLKWSF